MGKEAEFRWDAVYISSILSDSLEKIESLCVSLEHECRNNRSIEVGRITSTARKFVAEKKKVIHLIQSVANDELGARQEAPEEGEASPTAEQVLGAVGSVVAQLGPVFSALDGIRKSLGDLKK